MNPLIPILLSDSYDFAWASEYPPQYWKFFLMDPVLVKAITEMDWIRVEVMVREYHSRIVYTNPNYPLQLGAMKHLRIQYVKPGTQFILMSEPREHIIILDDETVITAR